MVKTDIRALMQMDIKEFIAADFASDVSPLLFNGLNILDRQYTDTPVTGPTCDVSPVNLSHTLSGATGTEDLTAAPLAKDPTLTLDLTGKKLVGLMIAVPTGNTGTTITVEEGATNGYDIGHHTLTRGEQRFILLSDDTDQTAVGASDKIIDISGTSGDVVNILAFFSTP